MQLATGVAILQETGWLQVPWPDNWSTIDIMAKELVPVILEAALWGHKWTGGHVCFHIDDIDRTSKHSLIMHLLRCFSFYASYHGLHFSA